MKRVKRNERTNLIKELRKSRSCDSKSYWKILNGPKKKCNIPISLNDFYEHFKQLASANNDASDEVNETVYYDINDTNALAKLNDSITDGEVKRTLNKMKNDKDPDCDLILK